MNVEERLREYILAETNWDGPEERLVLDYPLITNRVLDSLGIMHLVTFAEDEFGIEIDDEELVPENFGTIAAIANLITAKVAVLR